MIKRYLLYVLLMASYLLVAAIFGPVLGLSFETVLILLVLAPIVVEQVNRKVETKK